MKFHKDEHGAIDTKMLVAGVVIVGVLLAYLGGYIDLSLPSAQDKFSETVNRDALDVGIRVPIELKLTMKQDASTGANKAIIESNIKHRHDTDDDYGISGDYVPDPKLVSQSSFNTDVGSQGICNTIYSVNGNSFQTVNTTTYNSTVTSLASVQYGYSQNNYKVWTTSTVHTPPASPGSTSNDNSALLIVSEWKHYRKATNELLSSDTVTWIIYYKLPAYNADDTSTSTYTYYVFVPFNDYALVEDIKVDIWGYSDRCTIEWTTVETVTHSFWDFPTINGLFGKFLDATGVGKLKLVWSEDTKLATRIDYHWEPLRKISRDNDDTYGSHQYTYKIR